MNPSLPCIGKIDVVRPKTVGGSSLSQETEGDLTDKPAAIKSQPQPDVIAPVEILKRIMNTSYSDSRLSIAVYCLGQTIVLSSGPDSQQGKKHSGSSAEESKSMLLFNVERYATITLGLRWWDISQQFNWIEAWLDNLIDSKLAVCKNGLVQGYEVVPSGIFDTHVVHQNSLGIISFLQSHCLEDPGVYWLYKSAGEDVIQLFHLSTIPKELSSSPNPLPLVVRACAHEQFARLILNREDEFDPASTTVQRKVKLADLEEELHLPVTTVDQISSTSVSSPDVGPLSQVPAPPLLQTSSIPAQLAAVHHVYEAIRALMSTQKLQSSEADIRKWLPTSKVDIKLWSLILLLGEAYLSLGEAYKEDNQLDQAVKIIELACSTWGSLPLNELQKHVSGLCNSFSQQLNHLDAPGCPIKTTPQCDISFREVSSVCIFWAKVWLLVGDIYLKFIALLPPEGSEVVKEQKQALSLLNMPSDIEEELGSLKKRLKTQANQCVSCPLLNCRCRKGKDKKFSGNIFKYLKRSGKFDADRYVLAAVDCYEESHRAIQLPRNELLPLINSRKAIAWTLTAGTHLDRQKFEKAEEAYANAIKAYKEINNLAGVVHSYCNLAEKRRKAALEVIKKMITVHNIEFRNKTLEAAKLGFVTSLRYLMAAETEYKLAVNDGFSFPEELRLQVYRKLGDAHTYLGHFLSVEDTSVAVAELPGLKIITKASSHSSPPQLSALDFFQGALAICSSSIRQAASMTEIAYVYTVMARHHSLCCSRFLKKNVNQTALEHALLAEEYWLKSLECYGPNSEPHVFVDVLIERSILSFKLPEQSVSVLESHVARFLECRHISINDEELLPKDVLDQFWGQLRLILKTMYLAFMRDGERAQESILKAKDLYSKSMNAKRLSDLHAMHACWTAEES